ncbi:MAG TPA: helix-turn-helix domain-containing protein [Patescibacteria group bacterium]|nr:helix-turn-helix domain-containing protein [Patescibacteria group bacterium]
MVRSCDVSIAKYEGEPVSLMTLFEVAFKVSHDCPFCNISKKYPRLKMFNWCNREHDVIEIVVDRPDEYSPVIDEMSRIQGIIDKSSDLHNAHFFIKKCFCKAEDSVTRILDEFDLLQISPIVYRHGWEYYRVIAFKHKDLKGLMQRFEEKGLKFEILRKVDFDGFIASSLTLTADALFSDLTEKQMDALLTAYSNGYYSLPRKANVQDIAHKKRVSRTTYQEHLKKAENKLVASLVPYVQLFRRVAPEKRTCARAQYAVSPET